MRLSIVAAVACASVGIAAAQNANAAIRKTTNIAGQRLGTALQELARLRDLQVVYLSDAVDELRTSGAVGELTADETLAKLLSGTGLTYKYLDENAITVYPSAARASSRPRAGEDEGVWRRLRLAQATQSSASGSHSGAANNDSRPNGALEEIVVTAQKREERLQDVPISMSVLSGRDLDRSNDSVVGELSRVPGVVSLASGLGGNLLTVRGVASTNSNFAGTTTVGYYLDSVPFGFIRSALVPDANAYDLERIEVLRGPQGTLYGASSQNGVVRILTKDPDLNDLEFKLRTSGSSTRDGGDNYRGDMAVNLPIADGKLAARLAGGYEDNSGWIDKPNLGEKDANGSRSVNVRLKVKAQPTDALSMGWTAWHTRNETDGRMISLDDRTTPLVSEPGVEEYDIYAFNIGYAFEGFSLSSAASYIDYQNDTRVGDFGPTLPLLTTFASKVFSEEVNLNSTGDGLWRWSLGGIYRDVKDHLHQNVPGLFANPNGLGYDDYSESFAVFGEVTRKLFDERWELTGGVRYFQDDNKNRQRWNPSDGTGTVPLLRSSAEFDAVSPRVVLTWHASDRLTNYVSYSEGFRSGFSQSPTVKAFAPDFPAVDSDNLHNYELGSKGSLWGGLVNFDAAVFYIRWDDVQQSVTVIGPAASFSALINGRSASGPGAEFGLSIAPLQGLELGLNYSWNDLTLDDDVISAGAPLFFKGDRLTNSPETTAGVSLRYSLPLTSGYEAYFSGSASYISERQSRALDAGARVLVESDTILTSRLSFSIQAPAGWTASLFVENLNDEDGTPLANLTPPANGENRLRPRTIGLQFEYDL